MNDYLGNLALRNSQAGELNTVSLFQPRLPSLFESPTVGSQLSEATSLEQTDELIEPSRTILSPAEKGNSQVPQKKNSNSTQPIAAHLNPVEPELNSLVVRTQKHIEFVPSSPKLSPLPTNNRSHSLSPRMDHSEKQEPTIQVYIGRIEVRAVTASRPTNSKTSNAPNLTLEQYLRQRNEGKR